MDPRPAFAAGWPHRAGLVLCLVAGCAQEVAETPTYYDQVQGLMQGRCARCHGADPARQSLGYFRLDRFDPEDASSLDLWDFRDRVLEVTGPGGDPPMPPDYPLTDRERDTLVAWADEGYPRGTRANRAPTIELTEPLASEADQRLVLEFLATDADGDGLRIDVAAIGDTGTEIIGRGFGGAARRISVDTSTLLGPRRYAIELRADDGTGDGGGRVRRTIGEVDVDHGDQGATPRVTLEEPLGGETLAAQTTIRWTASDADPGDLVSATVELFRSRSDGTRELVAVLAGDIDAGLGILSVDTTGFEAGPATAPIRYVIAIEVTDTAGNQNSDASGPVTLTP